MKKTKPPQSDTETRATSDHTQALRLWLRMLACTNLIEGQIRSRLRSQFGITLPRFDLMSQLERSPEGLKMGELSKRMMVTGGNVTGITATLVAEGLVERRAIPGDRRAQAVRLTASGKQAFDAMAAEHEQWIRELLGGLSLADRDRLHALLGRLKKSIPVQGPGADGDRR